MTRPELVAYVSRPIVSTSKDAHGGIALGRFRDGVRRLTHFEATSMVGLDYDAGAVTAVQLHEAIGPGLHVVYSTFSSTPGHPKSRAILFLDREVGRDEHRRIMRALYARFAAVGIVLDAACKDATRWWFCPVVHPDRVAHFQVLS